MIDCFRTLKQRLHRYSPTLTVGYQNVYMWLVKGGGLGRHRYRIMKLEQTTVGATERLSSNTTLNNLISMGGNLT